MHIGNNIKYLRKQRGLTAKDLSEVIGRSRDAVTQYESGKSTPPVDVLASLSDYFGVAMDRLVHESLSDAGLVSRSGGHLDPAATASGPEESGLWDYRNLVKKVEELEAKIINLEKS